MRHKVGVVLALFSILQVRWSVSVEILGAAHIETNRVSAMRVVGLCAAVNVDKLVSAVDEAGVPRFGG